MSAKELIRDLIQEFRDKELLLRASAISFRVVVASIPTTLFVLAVAGAIGFEELWTEQVVPELRENVSGPVFAVLDDVVDRVLESQNRFWITIGAVLAMWGMAAIVDAVTRTLNTIHEADETRSWPDRIGNAILIGTLTGVCIVTAIFVVRLGPYGIDAVLGDGALVSVISFVIRWGIAAALLWLAVVLMVRVAPDLERPLRRVSVGAAITVGGWILTSLAFGLYLETFANYGSLFGQLATVYIALQYVTFSAIVYVGGLAADCVLVRESPRPSDGEKEEDGKGDGEGGRAEASRARGEAQGARG